MSNSRLLHKFIIASTILSMIVTPGCSRKFWREQAETDTYNAIAEKQNDQRWVVPRTTINPDQRSRFFDPYDADCKPMPPDDPAAHQFMRCANGIKGYHNWYGFGEMFSMENPQWLDGFGVDLGGNIDPVSAHTSVELRSISLQEAIELSYIHSRDYQFQLEELYLTALALTAQRFQFGVRYLNRAGQEPGVDLSGTFQPNVKGQPGPGVVPTPAIRRGGRVNETYRANSNWGIRQFLPAGGQWAVEVANSLTWAFGSDAQTKTPGGGIVLEFMQPLLFQAGRHVAMEGLTQSERNLLYQTRDLARFRKTFFTDVSSAYIRILQAQQSVTNERNNIQRLQDQIDIARFRDDRPNPSISAPLRQIPGDFMIPESLAGRLEYDEVDGFLRWRAPTISDADSQELLAISDDVAFQRAVGILLEFGGAGSQTASLETLQLLTQLSQSEGTLRTRERALQDQLDGFKILLGLPPDVQLDVDTDLLRPFALIDPSLTDLETRLKNSIDILNRGRNSDASVTFEDVSAFIAELQELADEFTQSALTDVEDEFGPVEDMVAGGESAAGRRITDEDERERVERDVKGDRVLIKVAQSEFEESVLDLETLQLILDASDGDQAFGKLDQDMDGVLQLTELEDLFDKALRDAIDRNEDGAASDQEILDVIGSLGQEIQESILQSTQSLQVVQARLRTELISLNPFRIPGLQSVETPTIEEAVRVGLENRLDLMNAKAEVMDARRRVEIAANALEATLDLVVAGSADPRSDTGRPLQYRSRNTQLDVGLAFDTPLDQIDERNDYATALVTYQRVRRAYMAFEDQVKQEIRAEYRSLRVAEQQLELRRRQLRQAGQQYEATALQVTAPQGAGRATTSFDLLNSLSSLLTAQNGLINEWVDYELSRLNIFRDMGIMEVDSAGIWVDEFYQQGQNSPSDSGFILDDPSSSDLLINPDPGLSDEPTFPLDDAVVEPFLPEQAPLPPSASRRVRDVDNPWTADRGDRRDPGRAVMAGRRIRDVLRAGFRRVR